MNGKIRPHERKGGGAKAQPHLAIHQFMHPISKSAVMVVAAESAPYTTHKRKVQTLLRWTS